MSPVTEQVEQKTKATAPDAPARVLLVGTPNVGKSVLFNALSGLYATVSNYPGTTVEISRGQCTVGDRTLDLIDTPGLYSLRPLSEDERVARQYLLEQPADTVVHVIDAKNVDRMLALTLQLQEAGLPVVLVVNMMDEAERQNVSIDIQRLAGALDIPVIGAAATVGRGIPELRQILANSVHPSPLAKPVVKYLDPIERALGEVAALCGEIFDAQPLSRRTLSLLYLMDDSDIMGLVEQQASPDVRARAAEISQHLKQQLSAPVEYHVALALKQAAQRLASVAVRDTAPDEGFGATLSRLMMRPLTGFPILILVVYFGLYQFVGRFGAGTAVDFLEGAVFGRYITPLLESWVGGIVPWEPLRDLFVGEFGLLTLGVRYALALILPIVTFFFLVFAIIEDTGYLPRLAMLVDRMFKRVGLSGRAVIPIVLGLGCDTMATVVTRTLPTRRERLIATLLLALVVPCSAQLGIIMALLAGRPASMAIWAGVMLAVFALVGTAAARILPGERPSFYMELPPLRLPQISNVLAKTLSRVIWYLREVIPLFLLASLLIWLLRLSGLFDRLVGLLRGPVRWIGLPTETAQVFLFGFFRRDYGAAGLFDLQKAGVLNGVQLTVASIALTLFLPCIAQFLINVKERGWRAGLGISAFVLVFSFSVAWVVWQVLHGLGVAL